jgi:hypothetical protein
MGFEAFRVELRGGPATYQEVDEAVRQLPHIHRDHQSVPLKGSTYYLLKDGQHVVEIEIRDAPVKLSCRFTLCHPPSVRCRRGPADASISITQIAGAGGKLQWRITTALTGPDVYLAVPYARDALATGATQSFFKTLDKPVEIPEGQPVPGRPRGVRGARRPAGFRPAAVSCEITGKLIPHSWSCSEVVDIGRVSG